MKPNAYLLTVFPYSFSFTALFLHSRKSIRRIEKLYWCGCFAS